VVPADVTCRLRRRDEANPGLKGGEKMRNNALQRERIEKNNRMQAEKRADGGKLARAV